MLASTGELRVLIVDDNRPDRVLYRHYLERDGAERFVVSEAGDAQAALSFLRDNRIDCIVLDVNLPGMDGLEMLRALEKENGAVPCPVVMLTGMSDESVALESLRRGAHDYLVKNLTTPDYLSRAIRNAIQKHQLEREKSDAELALRHSEERFRSVFASAAIGMSISDLEGRIVEVNAAYSGICGYSRGDLLGKTFYDITHPEDRDRSHAQHDDLIAGRIPHYVIEKRYVRKNGDPVSVRASISVLRDKHGMVTHTIALIEDTTQKRELEEQLRQSQKMEAVGQLAGGVAHDFNNLLTIVLGYTDLLLSRHDLPSDVRLEVDEVRVAGERARALTQQLLAFSRRQIMQPRVLDVNDVLHNMEGMLRRIIGEDVDLAVVLDPDAGRVKADPTQLEQVVMNLAVNARDAMPDGGRLTIETRPVYIDPAADLGLELPPGAYVLIAVSDTGSGMDAATRSHIFEPFFTTKEVGKGTGLGLSTAYGILKQSGGSISVYSEPGHGATFKVYLPRTDDVPETAEEVRPVATHRHAGTIMVVEDEEGVRRLLRQVLTGRGYQVLDAETATEALRVLGNGMVENIDLLMTDVVLPDMPGPELARAVLALRPDVKVLYMSGYTRQSLVRRNGIADSSHLLEKPFTISALMERLNALLAPAPAQS